MSLNSNEIEKRVKAKQRILVTTLTKRMAEDLASYVNNKGFRCRYLHSEIQTLERIEILRDLRTGNFDVLVGVNLLREGLDLPEVSMVAIMDADKEGFLRSQTEQNPEGAAPDDRAGELRHVGTGGYCVVLVTDIAFQRP